MDLEYNELSPTRRRRGRSPGSDAQRKYAPGSITVQISISVPDLRGSEKRSLVQ